MEMSFSVYPCMDEGFVLLQCVKKSLRHTLHGRNAASVGIDKACKHCGLLYQLVQSFVQQYDHTRCDDCSPCLSRIFQIGYPLREASLSGSDKLVNLRWLLLPSKRVRKGYTRDGFVKRTTNMTSSGTSNQPGLF